jgi:hypothetical protein
MSRNAKGAFHLGLWALFSGQRKRASPPLRGFLVEIEDILHNINSPACFWSRIFHVSHLGQGIR